MIAKELRERSPSDLQDELLALRKEQFNLRMQMATGQSGKSHRLREIRKDVARIKTVVTEQANQK